MRPYLKPEEVHAPSAAAMQEKKEFRQDSKVCHSDCTRLVPLVDSLMTTLVYEDLFTSIMSTNTWRDISV